MLVLISHFNHFAFFYDFSFVIGFCFYTWLTFSFFPFYIWGMQISVMRVGLLVIYFCLPRQSLAVISLFLFGCFTSFNNFRCLRVFLWYIYLWNHWTSFCCDYRSSQSLLATALSTISSLKQFVDRWTHFDQSALSFFRVMYPSFFFDCLFFLFPLNFIPCYLCCCHWIQPHI